MIVTGNDFSPGVVATATVAKKVKVFPLPLNAWLAEPPMDERSATTAIPVLGGIGAGDDHISDSEGNDLVYGEDGDELAFGVDEGLGVFLNGVDLPDAVYAECDVNHVIEEANRLLAGRGRFLSHWQGERETGLFFYGRSFADMKAAIASFIAAYPLCRGARIEQIA